MSDKPNPKNVAGGLKATIHNPHTSDAAKESAEERLSGMQNDIGAQESIEAGGKNTGNVVDPKTSEGAKEHAREVLHDFKEGKLNDPEYIPED
ncbi:hypothetical protein D9756_007395 [Leucocoprinus leucothites]|uniref:Conidiation-specific protein 6 n=1 Tax=Leucocoprinus leucothites TaxID=201217 RepID=A0A8H5D1J8_9AGAR|nr:hypothetical protein D9756_007395 [Leucoagaricus leucothites]